LAIANGEHEITHRPTNIDVNRLMAELYYAKGDMAKAEASAKIAASTGSKSAELHMIQGLIAMKMGDATGKNLVAQALQDDPYQTGPTADIARKAI
jgi:protein involved in temperature-dependent protein secretion